MATPTLIAGYLALFAVVGFAFVFVNLLLGKLVRPATPNEEKGSPYECGEPVIGSSFVQFDLRFYVVALLFIIFDVEIAFFFPWATVFGKATALMDENIPVAESGELTEFAKHRMYELGVSDPSKILAEGANPESIRSTASKMALTSFADIGVFFAVLLVGFAYVWKRGDLDWVRAVSATREVPVGQAGLQRDRTLPTSSGSVLSA